MLHKPTKASLSRCGVCVNVCADPWLDKHHPDRLGETLRRILPILIAMRDKAKEFGEHATVGVLWDFCSLPQGIRTPELEVRFKKGLYGINEVRSVPACASRAFYRLSRVCACVVSVPDSGMRTRSRRCFW